MVASVRDVVLAFGLREAIEQFADAFPEALSGPGRGSAEECFEFGEDLLDRIEVRRVGRQEAQLGAGALDGIARGFSLVAAEIVENDDVARPQARDEDLLDISGKAAAVNRAIEDRRRAHPVPAQGCQEGRGLPVTEGHAGNQPLAAPAATMRRCHVGLGPGLVDENEVARVERQALAQPSRTPGLDVGTVEFGRGQGLFLRVIRSRSKNRRIEP